MVLGAEDLMKLADSISNVYIKDVQCTTSMSEAAKTRHDRSFSLPHLGKQWQVHPLPDKAIQLGPRRD